jgi:predicted ATPase
MKLLRIELKNFLSYRQAALDLNGLVALVGPNASGKSNLVAALKLLGDIPRFGLQTALLRRGGFDQLRHRSRGRPYDPSIKIEFSVDDDAPVSSYELQFAAVAGGRYAVKLERGEIFYQGALMASFRHQRGKLEFLEFPEYMREMRPRDTDLEVPDGQSALPLVVGWGAYPLYDLLTSLQVVEINPARVRDLQEPTTGYTFEPDGSNTATAFESLSVAKRRELVDELAAVVPGLDRIEVRRFSNKMTLQFVQRAGQARREFLASQMSDGTLRAFGIILALVQPTKPTLIVIEEPEVAIHLGALRTLVEILESHTSETQILLTTHSADIVDALDVEALRVVWAEEGVSHVAPVAGHTRETVRTGLITPGELLRSEALDAAGR